MVFLFCSQCEYYVNECSDEFVDGFEGKKFTGTKENKEDDGVAEKNKDKKGERVTEHGEGK